MNRPGRIQGSSSGIIRPVSALLALFVLLALVVSGLVRSKAETGGKELSVARLERKFHDAGSAYDRGRMKEAIELYEDLLKTGYASKEVFFNLGNAFFRSGQLGRAILNYRLAWRMAPRDPDIKANIAFALEAAGVPAPVLSWNEKLLTGLSPDEWVFSALAGYWMAFLMACPAIIYRRWRGVFLRAALIMTAFALVALAGLWTWHGFSRYPEVVVINPVQQALFAPLEDSTPHFALPEGSVVRLRERSGEWARVTLGKKSGWIRQSACEPCIVGSTE